MKDSEVAGRGASALSESQIKPEIYTAINGKFIVEDELLNFLVIKMKPGQFNFTGCEPLWVGVH